MLKKQGFGGYSLHIVRDSIPADVIPHWCGRLPLSSRCAVLRKHNAPDQVVREMMEAWEKWRVEP
jgi:hypothetical protein